MKKMMVMVLGGVVVGAVALRPKCPEVETTAAVAAAPRVVAQVKLPEVVAVASYAMPEVGSMGRNLFEWRPSPPLRGPSPRTRGEGVETAAVVVVTPPADPPRTTEPAANYLGAFGPAETPILVFKQSGDVVNVPLRKP